MSLLKKKTINKCLGIDIGTSSIKAIELSNLGNGPKLENYGEVPVQGIEFNDSPSGEARANGISFLSSPTEEVVEAISSLKKEARFKTKNSVFSIPDFSTFFTSFELPPMRQGEIAEAVKYKANKYIPLSLDEMKIDWAIIKGKPAQKKGFFSKGQSGTKLEILLATVPNDVILKYQEIAKQADLNLLFLEAEIFSLIRSLVEKKKGSTILVDIGGRSTTCSLIEDGILKSSHSFDVSSNQFTYALSTSLDIDYNEAERLKKEIGIRKGTKEEQIIYPLIDLILREIRKISGSTPEEKNKISKIVLSGGSSLMPGLREYFKEQVGIVTIIGDPFLDIDYPSSLKEILKEMSPSYAISVGSALKGLDLA